MPATIRLARIRGVDVGANWSVLVILGLIVWSLGGVQLPDAHPGRPTWAYLTAAVLTAVVFLIGLLAHEMSHALVAIRNGLSVEGITLWMFGGVARLEGEARTPGAELRIAGIGPLVSLILGLGFGALALVVAATGSTGLASGTILWLSGINILLAVFNLLPAAPLDGGRLLRAALWKWRGDRTWAAVAAAGAGRVLAIALIVLGFWLLLSGPALSGLWMAFLGWFLLAAAAAEEQQARFAAIAVRDVMSADPLTVSPDLTVTQFVEQHAWSSIQPAFPLSENGHPAGLVTRDRALTVPLERRDTTPLRDIACQAGNLAQVTPEDTVADLLPRLNRSCETTAVVVSDGQLVGVVTPTDVVRTMRRATPGNLPRR